MSTEYTIAAIPTLYRGRQYRSRLEAKWAAFFDLLGWQHEYEPFDLGAWSPDFRLLGYQNRPALVEVKPIDRLDDGTCSKMLAASFSAGYEGPLILLGNAPVVDPAVKLSDARVIGMGWHTIAEAENLVGWDETILAWYVDPLKPLVQPDILHIHHDTPLPQWVGFFTEARGGCEEFSELLSYPDHTMELWARACNAVQWRGEGSQP